MADTLIVGLGNLDRGDDGAGILVARRLLERGFWVSEHTGSSLDLIKIWKTADDVVLVDAVVSGLAPGTVQIWNASNGLRNAVLRSSTHDFGLAATIELARSLDCLPKAITIYGIEAAQFTPGSRPCSEVLAGIDKALEQLTAAQHKVSDSVQ